MADENDLPDDPNLAPEEVPAEPVAAAPEHVEAEPAKPAHSPWRVRQAIDLGYSQADIDTWSADDLDKALYFGTQAAMKRNMGQPPEPQQKRQPEPPPPPPAFALPPELQTELDDFSPALKRTVELLIERGNKQDEQMRQMAQKATVDPLAQQVGAEIAKLPGMGGAHVQQGTAEHARQVAVWNQINYLANTGQINDNMPPDVVVKMAYSQLWGAVPAAQPARPAPTPTARPTHRLQELDPREALIAAMKADWELKNGDLYNDDDRP
jgi:hypothetical protein